MIAPTMRERWRRFHQARRTAAAIRAGRDHRLNLGGLDCASFERVAWAWAAPFAPRLGDATQEGRAETLRKAA